MPLSVETMTALLPALLLVAQPVGASAAAAAYPEAEVLRQFGEACSDVRDVDRAARRAVELGWEPFEAKTSTRLGRSIAERKGEFGETATPIAVDKAFTFRRTVVGRELFLMILDERYPLSERLKRSRICTLFDYLAPAQISDGAAKSWAGRAADLRLDVLGSSMVWEPGVTGPGAITRITYVDGLGGFLDPGLQLSSKLEDWAESGAPLP